MKVSVVAALALLHSAQGAMMGEKGNDNELNQQSAKQAAESLKAAQAPAKFCSPTQMALKEIQDSARDAISSAASQGIKVNGPCTAAGTLQQAASCAEKAAQKAAMSEYEEAKDEQEDEKWYEEAMKAVLAHTSNCAVQAAPCPVRPPSILETKAQKDSARAKQLTQEFKESTEETKKFILKAKMLKKKAEVAKEMAINSYQKAGNQAAEVAKARVNTAKALAACEEPAQEATACASASKSAKLQVEQAKYEAKMAEKSAKEAFEKQQLVTLQGVQKRDIKNKADCDAKAAKDASARIAAAANSFMSDCDMNSPCQK